MGPLAEAQDIKYKADVPEKILTPDVVETRQLGTLNFEDGVPTDKTVEKLYDNMDFYRGVESFMVGVPAASMYGYLEGMKQTGMDTYSLGIYKDMFDARSLWLTPNTTTLYGIAEINVKEGPTVLEVPSGVLGPVMDAYFRFVADVGFTGADQGKGGKYLFVPPGYKGELPNEGYHIVHTPTYRNGLLMRAFVIDRDIPKTVKHVEANWKLYPYSKAESVPEQHFVDLTGKQYNTIHANNFEFYEELNAAIQYEDQGAFGEGNAALWEGIGIVKGEEFNPDARMKEILVEAAAVGNATSRAVSFKPRDRRLYFYDDRQWFSPYAPENHEFRDVNNTIVTDWRTFMHYMAIGVTPAMAKSQVGVGSSYVFTAQDSNGETLSGDKVYSVTLPGPVPAKDFWSFTVYSNQHRSLLETNQRAAGMDSFQEGLEQNKDGSYTIWFSAEPPVGKENNWVQTIPGKSFSCIARLYGPLEPWFDKTWKPGDFVIEE
ncbi:hypothetical protein NH26_12800 [Flammeovirga pacifica]|uniref:DUF1254 domain-containing protein n=2 Tax=Flammeovirga pacifica TaxID=915059 RepID=A0A1S1Z5P2_FLAPC|nr:hypothetical protein NH26_12800 [Flammeovirga pacifica]